MIHSTEHLYRILKQQKEYYPLIIIYSICVSILTLATPISVQSLVNTFSFGPFVQPIFILSCILFSLLLALGLLKSLQYLIVEYLQRRIFAKVVSNISRSYFLAKKENFELENKENRFFDIIIIQKKLSYLITDGIALILQTFFGVLLIAFYHPYFIILGLLIIFSIIMPIYLYISKGLKSAFDESTAKYEVANFILDIKNIKSEGLNFQDKVSLIDHKISHFLVKRSVHFKTVFNQNIIFIILYALLNALLLGLGGYLVIANQLTVGQLVAAEIIVNAILSNFLYAQKYLESFYDLSASASKLNVFYNFLDQNIDQENKDNFVNYSIGDFHKKVKSIKKIKAPQNYLKIVKVFILCVMAFFFLLFITPWQQTSLGKGRVTALNPNDRIQMITAAVDGIIEEWLVQDGQVVKKGDSLLRLIDNDPNYLVRLESQRDLAIARFDAAKAASDTGRINYHRQESLVKEGLSAKKEFELAKITYKKLLAEEAGVAADLAKAEVELSRQQLQEVIAPRDGQILRILHGSGTTKVKAGETLVQFVPESDENIVELFIDGNDLPLIYSGRLVRLQFEGWPSVQFSGWPSVAIGSFGGIVSSVDPSVSGDGTFRVLVKPDPNDTVSWPDQKTLRQGARAVGIIILDQVLIGYEFWRRINGFPKSMSTQPDYLKDSVKKQ